MRHYSKGAHPRGATNPYQGLKTTDQHVNAALNVSKGDTTDLLFDYNEPRGAPPKLAKQQSDSWQPRVSPMHPTVAADLHMSSPGRVSRRASKGSGGGTAP